MFCSLLLCLTYIIREIQFTYNFLNTILDYYVQKSIVKIKKLFRLCYNIIHTDAEVKLKLKSVIYVPNIAEKYFNLAKHKIHYVCI